MISGNPQGRPPNEKGYIGALAATLTQYPRMVALKCADPVNGIAREQRFLPTVADLVAYCERETASMRRPVELADHNERIQREMAERRREGEAWAADRATRPTLQQMKDHYGPNWGIDDSNPERIAAQRATAELLSKANDRVFDRECHKAGVDPETATISPYLRKLLTGRTSP